MADKEPSTDNTLALGSIINVHRNDGSSTGGCAYLGVEAFNGHDQAMPQLRLRPLDSDDGLLSVPFSEVAWIDTLGTPFDTSKPPHSPN